MAVNAANVGFPFGERWMAPNPTLDHYQIAHPARSTIAPFEFRWTVFARRGSWPARSINKWQSKLTRVRREVASLTGRRTETAAVHYLHADARAQVVRESSRRQKLQERERERESTAAAAAIRSDPIKDG